MRLPKTPRSRLHALSSFSVALVVACSGSGSGTGESSTGEPTTTDPSDPSSSGDPTTVDPTPGTTTDTPTGSSSDGGTADTSGSTSGGADESSTTTVEPTTDGSSSSTAGESSTGEPVEYDCDNLVTPFVSEMQIPNARGYHDVYFDDAGHVLGFNGASAIVQVTYDGDSSVFLPGLPSTPQGMDVLDGDLLYVNDNGDLWRVTPDAQSDVVTSNLFGAYGVTIGPDNFAYVGFGDTIARVNPEDGEWTEFVSLNATARMVEFNLDSTQVYIATIGGGDVYVVPVDGELEPTDDPEVFASNVGDSWHDGITMDACGNLYVPEFWSSGLYRIDPEGVVTTVYNQDDAAFEHYGHGVEWGSGIGGFNELALYLPQPYNGNTVNEVVLGVPSAESIRTWDP